jgi:hypothetical protein
MAKRKFKTLELTDIEEGRFMSLLNSKLKECQKELIKYVQEHGPERSKKAKTKLKVDITLCFEGRSENDFTVKAQLKTELPGPPASVTSAIPDEEQDGTPCLWVRPSGSSSVEPQQGILTTQDGKPIDQETGKAVPNT